MKARVQSEKYHPAINLLYYKIMYVILSQIVGGFSNPGHPAGRGIFMQSCSQV
jgi:hypothetical protein